MILLRYQAMEAHTELSQHEDMLCEPNLQEQDIKGVPTNRIPGDSTPRILRKLAKLCEKCQKVFGDLPDLFGFDEERKFEHHENTLALEFSANDGCGVCAQVLLGFEGIRPWLDHPQYASPENSDDGEYHGVEDSLNARGRALEIPRPSFGILSFRRWLSTPNFLLTLSLPYPQGFAELEDDQRSKIELIRVIYRTFLTPTAEQGKFLKYSTHKSTNTLL